MKKTLKQIKRELRKWYNWSAERLDHEARLEYRQQFRKGEKMKLFDVVVKMVSNRTHRVRMRARSADEAMTQIIIKMEPYEVYSMKVDEVQK